MSFDCNAVFYLERTVFALRDQLLQYILMNFTNESEMQKDIYIFQTTTKYSIDYSIFQSNTNRPVLTYSGVLTRAALTSYDR